MIQQSSISHTPHSSLHHEAGERRKSSSSQQRNAIRNPILFIPPQTFSDAYRTPACPSTLAPLTSLPTYLPTDTYGTVPTKIIIRARGDSAASPITSHLRALPIHLRTYLTSPHLTHPPQSISGPRPRPRPRSTRRESPEQRDRPNTLPVIISPLVLSIRNLVLSSIEASAYRTVFRAPNHCDAAYFQCDRLEETTAPTPPPSLGQAPVIHRDPNHRGTVICSGLDRLSGT